MGRRGSWFSAIKRVFSPHAKQKPTNDLEKTSWKDKKGAGKVKHGDSNSFIPLFREPSSVEKIFLDYEKGKAKGSGAWPSDAADPIPRPPSFAVHRPPSPRASSTPIIHRRRERPEPTLRFRHASATKIQATYRGYLARKRFRALKGLVRLQGVVRGHNVKRQTMNAMKQMQLLVRVQGQIQSRRIQLSENQALRPNPNPKDTPQAAMAKFAFTQSSERDNNEDWDDSVLTKDEVEARLQRKVEAVIKRERATAYAHSNQLWKGATPKSPQTAVSELRSSGYPWWWNWVERHHSPANTPKHQPLKNFFLAPPTPQYEQNQTPKSTRSAVFSSSKTARTPPIPIRTPPANGSGFPRHHRPRVTGAESLCDMTMKDDDSLTSCPPFSVPHYMAPTASAQARVRAPKDRFPATPSSESQRRLSSPFKWKKGSLFSGKDSSSQRISDKKQSLQGRDNVSVDSTISLPAGVGRKPFNRFV